ncbi:gas vesicle protein K [Methanoplanus endosymbiosus]|uniref:Gas vesicle protein K n=1 Tax=Methanoplanus endosymbiosus TaxID=33865 RepID=A0A9E7PND5_9EURY|nr:gas vesicle protein K [Methanoplanus endosymbiosus]UUX93055.1 gas vesicle protein K [Methanoplanus endosymbiosus]
MALDIDEDNLKSGILGIVIAVIEIVRDAIRIQAIRRMDSGRLTDDEIERLGQALMELDIAIEEIKVEHDLTDTVSEIRNGLDDLVDDLLNQILNPEIPEEIR